MALGGAGGGAGGPGAASASDEGPMDLKEAMASVEADYKADYFVSGEGEMRAYAGNCLFTDDFAEFRGTDRFKRNVRNLGALIVPGTLALDYDLGSGVREDGRVRAEWRFSGVLALPWQPRLAAAGSTTHVFGPDGRVIEHHERWDSDPRAVVRALLRPAAKEPRNDWERGFLALHRGDWGGAWSAAEGGALLASSPVVALSLAALALTGEGLPGALPGAAEGLAWLLFAAAACSRTARALARRPR